MVHMKTAKCPPCGGMVFKLAGKASKLCHDECLKCRRTRDVAQTPTWEVRPYEGGEWQPTTEPPTDETRRWLEYRAARVQS